MKNYRKSDYAVNKYAKGIVYRGQLGTEEVSLQDFLDENPGLDEQDFSRLKRFSDAIYYKQDRDTHKQSRLNVSVHGLEENAQLATPALEDDYIRGLDRQQALTAARLLLEGDNLTPNQRRRFVMYMLGGLSSRKIAEREGVTQRAVMKSLQSAKSKLKKCLIRWVLTPPLK